MALLLKVFAVSVAAAAHLLAGLWWMAGQAAAVH